MPRAAPLRAPHASAIIFPDNDQAGRQHARQVARSRRAANLTAWIVPLPGLPEHDDPSDYLDAHGAEALAALVRQPRAPVTDADLQDDTWAAAQCAPEFLATVEPEVDWLVPAVLAPATITEWFSPRGLGKTQRALALAVLLARAGYRVLHIDRGNLRREVRRRLRGWGGLDTPSRAHRGSKSDRRADRTYTSAQTLGCQCHGSPSPWRGASGWSIVGVMRLPLLAWSSARYSNGKEGVAGPSSRSLEARTLRIVWKVRLPGPCRTSSAHQRAVSQPGERDSLVGRFEAQRWRSGTQAPDPHVGRVVLGQIWKKLTRFRLRRLAEGRPAELHGARSGARPAS